MKRISLLLALSFYLFPLARADDLTRILFIGNSYTGQIKKTVTSLIEASLESDSTEIEFIHPGGKTLEFHLQTDTTVQRIKEGSWDLVVLQDQSQTPTIFPKKFEDAAVELDKLIDDSGAQTVFYQTWGRRDGDKMDAERFPDYESMQEALSESYQDAAKRCDAILAPVGDTWAKVREADPKLGTALYKEDGSHPSEKGAYLAACVFYATFFKKPPSDIAYRGGLPDDEAAMILKAIEIPGAQPEARPFPLDRTLTNADGTVLDVQITGRSKTHIYFTARGKSHRYDIKKLSEADQSFVSQLPINQ